ncbi:signal peptidase II [Poseidonocella sedimentorum]|uniref:Lipoprotein signal peptidase n=1 Tax=Poseidonocella sedimentorum TaxID=871652 RepID=A0A1I6E9J3_9RHOB|nr:signal peptidase II [Poseidonocella sedimentorum]SFR14168.1 signal peptidase II [Poseidonocella sedimentorum]
MRALWTAVVIFLADQASKLIVVHWMDLAARGVIEIAPPLLTFRMAWNTGINFGLFSGRDARWILIGIALAIVAGVLLWMWRERPGKWAQISAGVLIGGALGNVVDRVAYGAVADFLNMSCCGIDNPFVFNIADVAIFAGAAGLILFTGPSKGRGARAG